MFKFHQTLYYLPAKYFYISLNVLKVDNTYIKVYQKLYGSIIYFWWYHFQMMEKTWVQCRGVCVTYQCLLIIRQAFHCLQWQTRNSAKMSKAGQKNHYTVPFKNRILFWISLHTSNISNTFLHKCTGITLVSYFKTNRAVSIPAFVIYRSYTQLTSLLLFLFLFIHNTHTHTGVHAVLAYLPCHHDIFVS